ncbi:VTT domain-containing protein [Roseibacterium sp. SDUM158017]|uniref:DedA family protein n=1 Tax=Roseicyclus salinarum TaxID=3036773 RepID=UPI002415203A|nr:VTT domain-containing protein [Roseibacterium sp. SDUM158017]MDG4648119.1 VTT domain-containing protein [Roseibacterium sp. SDUM158017]
MTETLLALVPVYGIGLVAVVTFLSCLALPVPSSLVMLAAGGFAASGDLVLSQVALAALGGAIAGDQAGYQLGRFGRRLLAGRRLPASRARLLAQARRMLHEKGAMSVFLSRWLFSPLGPYVNFAGGAAHLPLGRFTRAAVAGEAVWVAIYVGLGAAFAEDLVALADILGSASGLLAALAAAGLLLLWLRAALRQRAGAAR